MLLISSLNFNSEVIDDALDHRAQKIAFLSGPTFAKEIMLGHPMAAVVASKDKDVANFVCSMLNSTHFKGYTTDGIIMFSKYLLSSSEEVIFCYVNHVNTCLSCIFLIISDVISVEIGGAIKNPLAIGAGVLDGLGYGASTLAGFVTRGCSEMRKVQP